MPTTLDPPADLMAAAAALDPERFERLVDGLLRVRAGRAVRTVRADEAALLARINAGPPPHVWAEYHRLRDRLRREALTPGEHADLIALSDAVEAFQADRAGALAELAAVRGQTLPEVMVALDIAGPVGG